MSTGEEAGIVQTDEQSEPKKSKQKIQHDQIAKSLLKLRTVLAWILKSTTDEFKRMDLSEVEKWVFNPAIGSDTSDDEAPPQIPMAGTESSSLNDGSRYFDVKFYTKDPKKPEDSISLIINIEVQTKFKSENYIHKRAEYYLSRLISGQNNTIFANDNFEKIKKVYSIWICTDPIAKYRNTITVFPRTAKKLYGRVRAKKTAYDTSEYIIVGLNDNYDSNCKIIRMLDLLLTEELKDAAGKTIQLTAEEKREWLKKRAEILQKEFNISQEETEWRLLEMCDLSDRYRAEDEARGEARGKISGGAKEIICFAKDIGYTYEKTKARLKQRLNINDDEAENYMKLYWDEK